MFALKETGSLWLLGSPAQVMASTPLSFTAILTSLTIASLRRFQSESRFIFDYIKGGGVDGSRNVFRPSLAVLGPPRQQVIEQSRSIHKVVEDDMSIIGVSKFTQIQYEVLCRNTENTLRRIQKFLDEHGVSISTRGKVPPGFSRRSQNPSVPHLNSGTPL